MRTLFVTLLVAALPCAAIPLVGAAPGVSVAHAQDVDPDVEVARRRFEDGRRYYEKSDYRKALVEFEAARIIKHQNPAVGVLVLSQHIEPAHTVELVAHSGFGYLLKDRVLDVDEFLDVAERVAHGGSALDPRVVARLVAPHGHSPITRLSEREREVLALMAEGLSNSAIAQRLHVSDRTVEAHVRHVLIKLDIPDHQDAHRRVLAVLTHVRAATNP